MYQATKRNEKKNHTQSHTVLFFCFLLAYYFRPQKGKPIVAPVVGVTKNEKNEKQPKSDAR